MSRRSLVICALLCVSSARPLRAETVGAPSAPHPSPPVWLDVEVDPLAYLLQGYSIHVGVRAWEVRLDLGAFAVTYPAFLAPNADLDGRAHGAGLKLDWRFAQRPQLARDWQSEFWRGPFVGLSASYAWLVVTDPESSRSASQFQLHLSARAGWDIPIGAGFYLAPWASLGPVLGAEPIQVAGRRWDVSPIEIFATVHLGWRSPWL